MCKCSTTQRIARGLFTQAVGLEFFWTRLDVLRGDGFKDKEEGERDRAENYGERTVRGWGFLGQEWKVRARKMAHSPEVEFQPQGPAREGEFALTLGVMRLWSPRYTVTVCTIRR